MQEPPILPQDPKERQLAIRRLCQELRESRAFAWFIGTFSADRDVFKDKALADSTKPEQREQCRNMYVALKAVVAFVDDQDAQAIEILRRQQQ